MNGTSQKSTKTFSFFITLFIVCFVLVIFYGANLFRTILVMIICTGGLGLIPIIILFNLFWLIVHNIIKLQYKTDLELSISQKKIITYINSCEKANISKNEIIHNLVNIGGWKIEDIEDAYSVRDEFKYYDNKKIF